MTSERSASALTQVAPAKVNLFLEVLGRRPDGYHDLETLMVAVTLYDRLEFESDDTGAVTLTCDHPGLSCGPDNLVLKAAESLRRHANHGGGARIRLEKRIPLQAGLAGGSSDAAAALKGLNTLWGLGLPDEELARLGATIGSDVPFFFSPGAAWCTGRGEKVEPLTPGRTLDLVLCSPGVGLSTAAVFGAVKPPADPVSGAAMRAAVGCGDIAAIGNRLHNRLQEAAEALCPPVRDLRRRLEETDPAGCLMTGSGSTVYALCRDRSDAMRVARTMSAEVAGPLPQDGAAGPVPAGPAGGRMTLHVVRSCL